MIKIKIETVNNRATARQVHELEKEVNKLSFSKLELEEFSESGIDFQDAIEWINSKTRIKIFNESDFYKIMQYENPCQRKWDEMNKDIKINFV